MGQWRLVMHPDIRLDIDDPNTTLLVQWLTGRLIPDLKDLPFDFVIEIRTAERDPDPPW